MRNIIELLGWGLFLSGISLGILGMLAVMVTGDKEIAGDHTMLQKFINHMVLSVWFMMAGIGMYLMEAL